MTAMMKLKLLGYLSLIPIVGLWSCSSSNQLASGSRVVYDDLYGGVSTESVAANAVNERNSGLYANQNQYTDYIDEESIDSYYDESYLSSRDVQRAVSDKAGYNSGYQDGYFAGRNMNYGAYWPGSSMMNYNLGFRMGMNSAYFMAGPMFGWGYNRYSMWNSPFMYSSMGYDPFMTGMYGGWGSPYYGYGFGSSYYMSSMMYGMYGGGMYGGGYNPWSYYSPIGLSEIAGNTRTYGPRTNAARTSGVNTGNTYGGNRVANGTSSTARRSNSVGNTSSSRRVASSSVGDAYYARPRSTGNGYGSTANSAARSSSSVRSSGDNSNYYYSAPRSSSSSAGRTSSPSNATTRSGAGSSSNSSGRSYSAPARSNNSYSQPSYNQPSYSAPSRSSSGGSYSAPARSSAPSGGGGRSSGPR